MDLRQRFPVFGVAQMELQVGMLCLRAQDGGRAEIDADAVRRLQRGKQVTTAATQLKHALSRRNQEPHELVIRVVINGVDRAPSFLIIDGRLDMLEKFALAPAKGR